MSDGVLQVDSQRHRELFCSLILDEQIRSVAAEANAGYIEIGLRKLRSAGVPLTDEARRIARERGLASASWDVSILRAARDIIATGGDTLAKGSQTDGLGFVEEYRFGLGAGRREPFDGAHTLTASVRINYADYPEVRQHYRELMQHEKALKALMK